MQKELEQALFQQNRFITNMKITNNTNIPFITTDQPSAGFGLAPLKPEGQTIVYDASQTIRKVKLSGYDADFKPVTEVITINGTDPIESKNIYRTIRIEPA